MGQEEPTVDEGRGQWEWEATGKLPEEAPSPSISSRTIIFFLPLGPHSTGPVSILEGQAEGWQGSARSGLNVHTATLWLRDPG